MSDHVDGPRTLADPAIDVTDLYAFISPENSKRTVLIANVFPFAGDSALFSNVVNYSIAVRRVRVAALSDAARFEAGEAEIRIHVSVRDAETSGQWRTASPDRGLQSA